VSRSAFTVALVGCDGAGKTTVARRLEGETDRPVRYLYMGVSADSSNRSLPTTRLAHRIKRAAGAPPDTRGPRETLEESKAREAATPNKSLAKRARKSARSTLRLTNRLAEEWYRQLLASAWSRRGAIVIFDRHFVADYHAYDMSGQNRTLSRRLHGWLLSHAYPRPDLVIYLDASPEVLHARKGEGTLQSLARRRTEYLRLGEVAEHFAVVSAEMPLDDVVSEVAGLVREFDAHRRIGAERRLRAAA
jgi:thymidylate kinase